MLEISTPERISREIIPNLRCVSTEVLDCAEEFLKRRLMLQRAAQLSHSFYTKTKIIFETQDGTKEVITTIWAATDKNIILKGGVTLPVCCIREVAFN